MTSVQQIFKTIPPLSILLLFFQQHAELNDNHYHFNKTLFKKALFNNAIAPFLLSLEPFYFSSKLFYLHRKIDFNKFISVLRQLSHSLNIPFHKKMSYSNSSYDILYAWNFGSLSTPHTPAVAPLE
jgi:hypothetical protein